MRDGSDRRSILSGVIMGKLALALVGLGMTLAYLALAILGQGGMRAFFSHPPLIALAILCLAMAAVTAVSDVNMSPGIREDRSNRWVIAVLGAIGLLGAWLPAYTDRIDVFTIDGEAVRWLGVGVLALGGVLRIWPIFVLGRRFSGLVAIQPEHRLVTTGIYGVIRHPSYLGLLVIALGWGLAFRAGSGIVLALFLVPVLLARIRAEERLLCYYFGAAYETYRARTWCLVPGVY